MRISRKAWNNYISLLRAINDKAASELVTWMNINGGDGLLNVDIRDSNGNNIIDAAYLIAQKYGDASAAVSAQMYEAIAELSGVYIPPAELEPSPTYGEVAKTVQGVLKTSQNREEISSAVGRLVKQTGARTTRRNARRDGAQFAWIPSGDTCAFCIMLASNGWMNARKADHKDHIHSNCDCTYAVRFNEYTQVAGYEPEKYREQYDNAEGSNYKEKLNSMRRRYYAENREDILSQKISASEKRAELNASSAEETKV